MKHIISMAVAVTMSGPMVAGVAAADIARTFASESETNRTLPPPQPRPPGRPPPQQPPPQRPPPQQPPPQRPPPQQPPPQRPPPQRPPPQRPPPQRPPPQRPPPQRPPPQRPPPQRPPPQRPPPHRPPPSRPPAYEERSVQLNHLYRDGDMIDLQRELNLYAYRGYRIDRVVVRVRNVDTRSQELALYVNGYLEDRSRVGGYENSLMVRGWKEIGREIGSIDVRITGWIDVDSITVYMSRGY